MEQAQDMPLSFSEVSNQTVFSLAEEGNHEACQERLIRHVMVVHEIDWDAASEKVALMKEENYKVLWWITLPYKVGIATALFSGAVTIPMVFSKSMAKWFNHHFVTMEVPEKSDLDTWLEVGAWTWNWMEPPTGVACFVLLTLQFSRAQMQNMDLKPFTDQMKTYRSNRLADLFPEYDRNIVKDYARTQSMNPRR